MTEAYIPFAPPTIGQKEVDAVVSALRSGWLTTGAVAKQVESWFIDNTGAEGAVAVNSATAALHLALESLGVGPGDAVFTTTMTFCSTAHVIEHVGATPVLIDVEPNTLNIDTSKLAPAIEDARSSGLHPSVILPVHYAGHPCDLTEIYSLAATEGLAVIEDAAHALPAFYNDRPIGAPAPLGVINMVAYSFYATKNVTGAEGGLLVGPEEFISRARQRSLHGMSKDAWQRYEPGASWEYDVIEAGWKYNLSDLNASLVRAQLEQITEFDRARRYVADSYLERLAGVPGVTLPVELPAARSAWHLFPIRIDSDTYGHTRNELISKLHQAGVGTSVHFKPIHLLSYYRNKYNLTPNAFPVASRAFDQLLSLPIYPLLTADHIRRVVDALVSFSKSD